MIRSGFLCLFIIQFFNAIYAQQVSVVDAENGFPLQYATVSSASTNAVVNTDEKGEASLLDFKEANDINISLIGYESQQLSYEQLKQLDFKVVLLPLFFDLGEVVVSATKWKQNRQKTPVKITAITPQSIALQNPQTAADLLGTSGNVFIQKSQLGGGSPMIRGFSTNRLLYAVDGVRMNTAIFRSGNLQNVIALDPFTVERAEVLFGPGSVIYGSDAIGGVMSFQTLTPQLTEEGGYFTKGNVSGRYSSASNENTFHFDVQSSWEKWAFVSSFSSHDFGDLRMGRNGPDDYLRPFYVQRQDSNDVVIQNEDPLIQRPTGYSQINLMQKVRFQPNALWDIQYGFHYSISTDNPRYDRLVRLRNGNPRSAEWKYGPQLWMMNNLNVTHTGSGRLYNQMAVRLAHQRFEESRIDRDFNSLFRSNRVEEVSVLSVNIDFNKSVNDRATLLYGIEGVVNDVVSTGEQINIIDGNRSMAAARYPHATWQSYGMYAAWQQDVTDRLHLHLGTRYNIFYIDADFSNNLLFFPFPQQTSSLQKSAFTGSIGAVYTNNHKLSIIANFSTGFRAPNVDDVGKVFDSEPGAVVIPNTNLRSEYAYNSEIGITKIFGKRVKLGATVFYTLLDDAMVRRNTTFNGQDSIIYNGELSQVQSIQNAAEALVYGFQTELEIKFGNGLSFSTDFNYQIGEEELADGSTSSSRHAAPWFGTSRLVYKEDRYRIMLSMNYQGEKSFEELPLSEQTKDFLYALDENGNPYAPAWYSLDFKTIYHLNDLFSVSAGVENITDQRYRTYSSGIAAPGRNMVISGRVSF
jgi:hemoglobin/transferrin/lactoferrin receptor protein